MWKWTRRLSILLNVIGAIILAANAGYIWIGFAVYILGSGLLAGCSWHYRDWSLFLLCSVWLVVDVVGLIRWF